MNGAASLKPGTGRIDLTAFATLDRMGAALDYQQRLARTSVSTFAQAWAGLSKLDAGSGGGWRADGGVNAGLRWSF
ncbi:MAG: hypothetical protein SF187_23680 [Deltaproteobacteria bacterium]|nr:hypothetical protein [Deltaproteobacteria bacterium]